MAENFSYPLLTPEDCVAFFREASNISISEEDFRKPESRRWQAFYGCLFELMTGRPADHIQHTRLYTASDCDYPDLHEESFVFMTFVMALQKKMAAAGVVEDFTARDLLDPKPKRLLRIMSGAINFIRFGFQREEVFNKKKNDLERQRETCDSVLKENADLKKLLQARREVHASVMLKMKQVQDETDAVSVRMQDLHKQREVLQRNLSEMKNDVSQRNAANDQVRVQIVSAQAEVEKLSERIVQSPERVRAEQDRAKNRILALRGTVDDKQARLEAVQRQKEAGTAQKMHADRAMKILTDIPSQQLGELERESERLSELCQESVSSLQTECGKRETLKQIQAARQDKLSKLHHQHTAKTDHLTAHIAQLTQLKENMQDPRGSSESKKASLIESINSSKSDTQVQNQATNDRVEKIENLYYEILQQVEKKNLEVANSFSEWKAIMKQS